jgi:phosphoribosylformimino-5-aminoimidazole carboxamide ribotide isomerase
MIIIPAIDIIEGKCVRLTRGDYSKKKVYDSNPLEVARKFEDAGLRYLHVVDLDGAKAKRIVNHAVLTKIAQGTKLHVDFGGGVQSEQDIKVALDAGAEKITGGSIAVRDRDMFTGWMETYGNNRIILGADVRGEEIAIGGWQESSGARWRGFLQYYAERGIRYVISTDIDRDGMLQGPSLDLYRDMRSAFPDLDIIASGGISTVEDLKKLRDIGVYGAIVGKAIYEGKIGLADLKKMDN